eukprot:907404-Pleurochrysis_carterae.AAC.1
MSVCKASKKITIGRRCKPSADEVMRALRKYVQISAKKIRMGKEIRANVSERKNMMRGRYACMKGREGGATWKAGKRAGDTGETRKNM